MEFIKGLLQKEISKRVATLALIGVILYLMRSILNLFLLTFIFTYLIYSAQSFLITKLKKVIHIKQKVMIAFLYLVLAAAFVFVVYKYVPVMLDQSIAVISQTKAFLDRPDHTPIEAYLISLTKDIDISGYMEGDNFNLIFKSITSIGKAGFDLLVAIILSLFFLLEKNRIIRFTSKFKESKLAFIYKEIQYFGEKFLHSFGKVIQAQITIAFINSILSIAALWIMGFPKALGLGVMIFVLGLIPVAGVLISLLPLSMIAFTVGGFKMVIYVLIMVAVLHALESYILNPKLMSSKTELPVFYTFLILIVSEHFIGVWGLIIGIPIFMFLLDILSVSTANTGHKD